MSFVGSLMGSKHGNQGGAGLNYNADTVNLLQPTTLRQANDAYGQTQSGLGQQQNFINALQSQGGINNQANVFAQQQALANQLQSQANGTAGPSIAQTQLNQNTGQNMAAQAALMAGQRGSGSNTGLMARQIGQQGAATQQQATGQSATLGAQEQWAAMQALQQQQAAMGNMATQQVGQQANALNNYNQFGQNEQQNLLNNMSNFNNQQVGMQSNVNNANAGVSQAAAQGQQAMLGGVMSGISGAAMMGSGGAHGGYVGRYADGGVVPAASAPVKTNAPSNTSANSAAIQNQKKDDEPDTGAGALFQGMKDFSTSVMGGGKKPPSAPGAAMPAAAPQNYDLGGDVTPPAAAPLPAIATPDAPGPQSMAGKSLNQTNQDAGGASKDLSSPAPADSSGSAALASGIKGMFGSGIGKMISGITGSGGGGGGGGGGGIGSLAMLAAAHGGVVNGEKLAGKKSVVPGKASVKGDNPKNDTVAARLSPGEIVIPRSVVHSDDPAGNAAKFVSAVLARKGTMKR